MYHQYTCCQYTSVYNQYAINSTFPHTLSTPEAVSIRQYTISTLAVSTHQYTISTQWTLHFSIPSVHLKQSVYVSIPSVHISTHRYTISIQIHRISQYTISTLAVSKNQYTISTQWTVHFSIPSVHLKQSVYVSIPSVHISTHRYTISIQIHRISQYTISTLAVSKNQYTISTQWTVTFSIPSVHLKQSLYVSIS